MVNYVHISGLSSVDTERISNCSDGYIVTGYGNEEAVPVNVIFPSLGPTAIKEQIKRAELDDEGAELEDEQTGSDENITKEVISISSNILSRVIQLTNFFILPIFDF